MEAIISPKASFTSFGCIQLVGAQKTHGGWRRAAGRKKDRFGHPGRAYMADPHNLQRRVTKSKEVKFSFFGVIFYARKLTIMVHLTFFTMAVSPAVQRKGIIFHLKVLIPWS
jgi:hypothetical protein